MSRALKKCAQTLRDYVMKNPSRMNKIASGAGDPGTRAAPVKAGNNDAKIGVRLDRGDAIERDGKMYVRYNLQANKEAEDATVRAAAMKDSHKVWASADVELDSGKDPEEICNSLFEELEKKLEE